MSYWLALMSIWPILGYQISGSTRGEFLHCTMWFVSAALPMLEWIHSSQADFWTLFHGILCILVLVSFKDKESFWLTAHDNKYLQPKRSQNSRKQCRAGIEQTLCFFTIEVDGTSWLCVCVITKHSKALNRDRTHWLDLTTHASGEESGQSSAVMLLSSKLQRVQLSDED